MARRRYFRYYPRTRVAKKKWATNYKTIECSNNSSAIYKYEVLCENKAQSGTPTPVILKAGNFKIQGDCSVSNPSPSTLGILYLRVFVLYVPEGWALTNLGAIVTDHPEWIMAWSAVDLPVTSAAQTSGGNKFSLSSRLKRNLNSGDKIVFYIDPTVTSSDNAVIHVLGAAQYWTCAN